MPGDYALPGGLLLLRRDLTLSPVEIAANTTAEQLVACAGARPGDLVTVNKPTAQAGIGLVGARASAVDEIGLTFANVTGGALTPTAAEVYLVSLHRG